MGKNEKNRKIGSKQFEPTDNTQLLSYHSPRSDKNPRTCFFFWKKIFEIFSKILKNRYFYDVIMQFQKFFHSQVELISEVSLILHLSKSDKKWGNGRRKATKKAKIAKRLPPPLSAVSICQGRNIWGCTWELLYYALHFCEITRYL